MIERALQIKKAILVDTEQTDIAATLHLMASIRQSMGAFSEAQQRYIEALSINRKG